MQCCAHAGCKVMGACIYLQNVAIVLPPMFTHDLVCIPDPQALLDKSTDKMLAFQHEFTMYSAGNQSERNTQCHVNVKIMVLKC